MTRSLKLTSRLISQVVLVGGLFAMLGFGACDEPCGNLCEATPNKPKAWPADRACITDEAGDEYCANDCERCLRKVVGRVGSDCLNKEWSVQCANMAKMICSGGACRGADAATSPGS